MLFEVRDNDDSAQDSKLMEDFFKKVVDLDSTKVYWLNWNAKSDINNVVKVVKQINSDNPNSEKRIKYKFDVPVIAEKSENLQVDQRQWTQIK